MSAMLKQLLLVAFAHYAFGSVRVAGLDMTQSEAEPWVNMDLYLANMSSLSRDESWAATMQAYTTSDPATGFSISSLAPVPDLSQPYASLTKAYWSSGGYTTRSDEFVRAAIDGTGEASGWDAESRRELLTKGAAYEVVRQNIFYRLRSAVDLCSAGQTASSALALQWEIGYALHAGSLEGTDGSGSGKSTYALADKRCPQFGTCVGDSLVATSNVKALAAWQAGISLLLAGDCVGALHEYDTIVAQLTVPLVQGMLREAYEVDPDGGACCAHGVVEVAEGWAFTAPILPQLAACDAAIASSTRENMALSLTPTGTAHVGDGFRTLKARVESLYPCLRITCTDVGGMLTSDGQPIAGMEPCVDSAVASPSSTGLVTAVIVLAVVLALCAAVYLHHLFRSGSMVARNVTNKGLPAEASMAKAEIYEKATATSTSSAEAV
jgi:hypothetical protein